MQYKRNCSRTNNLDLWEFNVPYITTAKVSAEEKGLKRGREEGVVEGLHKSIFLLLDLRFGASGQQTQVQIEAIKDVALLETIVGKLATEATLDEIRSLYANPE